MSTRDGGEEPASEIVDVDALSADERIALAPRIRAQRLSKNWTMQQLAAAADVDRKTLRTFENGQRALQPAKLRAVLEALDIPQRSDFDRYDERTRSFIASTAPVFAQLPESAKSEAQGDVLALLMAKLARAAGIPSIGVAPPAEDRESDAPDDEGAYEAYAARKADPDTEGGEA